VVPSEIAAEPEVADQARKVAGGNHQIEHRIPLGRRDRFELALQPVHKGGIIWNRRVSPVAPRPREGPLLNRQRALSFGRGNASSSAGHAETARRIPLRVRQ